MNGLPKTHHEIPIQWGWYYPKPHLVQILTKDLQFDLPPEDLPLGRTLELIAFNEGLNDVLLRHLKHSDKFSVIHLSTAHQRKINTRQPSVRFTGTFQEFASIEQTRHEIEQHVWRQPLKVPSTCPVCFATVTHRDPAVGLWDGVRDSKTACGPLMFAKCKKCGSELHATPTHLEAEQGVLRWGLSKWGGTYNKTLIAPENHTAQKKEIIIVDAMPPDEANQRMIQWRSEHPEIWSQLGPQDLIVDVIHAGEGKTLHRYRILVRESP